MNLPYGYTNKTWRQGSVASKAYLGPHASLRLATETLALRHFVDYLPVPKLLDVDEVATILKTEFVKGVHGQTLIEKGEAELVLSHCGRLLKEIQRIPPELLFGALVEPGRVIGHGDFGPQNLLFSPLTKNVIAVIDWEWMHLARPFEDVAWAEWIIRTHHPNAYSYLNSLFDEYGSRPSWTVRHNEMVSKCHSVLAFAVESGSEDVVAEWHRRIKATESFRE